MYNQCNHDYCLQKKQWKRWTKQELEILIKCFKDRLQKSVIPLQHEVLLAQNRYPILKERAPRKIQDKLRAMLKKQMQNEQA